MGNLNEHIGFQLKGIVNILFCEKWWHNKIGLL
jgi:hypothetical protein